MLEAMAALILAIVGAVLFVSVMIYGIYIAFYPLHKTVEGGIEAMKAQAEEQKRKGYVGERCPNPQWLGMPSPY